MSFIKTIKTIKNNKTKLLNFIGYSNINEFTTENGFDNTRDAF